MCADSARARAHALYTTLITHHHHYSRYRDVFISYGHHEEVSPFAFKLNADLNERNITTWIDTDIDSGERWREAIQDAIKYV